MLSILKLKPEISQKELTYLLDMSKQALAELLAKLEKNGYVTREASEADRRSVIIRLTEAGAAVAGEMEETPPDMEKLFECLSEEEQNALADYLQRLIDRLDEQSGGDDEDWRRHMKERFMERGHHFDDSFGGDRNHIPGFFGGGFRGRLGLRARRPGREVAQDYTKGRGCPLGDSAFLLPVFSSSCLSAQPQTKLKPPL